MPTSDYTPSAADVGAVLRARTKDVNGNEVGTFTPETRPTLVEVDLLIARALGRVSTRFGDDLPEERHDDARSLAAIYTAMLIELSYFPEQVATGRSPYNQLRDLYNDQLKELEDALGLGPGDTTIGSDAELMPKYFFPEDIGGLVGWGTRF